MENQIQIESFLIEFFIGTPFRTSSKKEVLKKEPVVSKASSPPEEVPEKVPEKIKEKVARKVKRVAKKSKKTKAPKKNAVKNQVKEKPDTVPDIEPETKTRPAPEKKAPKNIPDSTPDHTIGKTPLETPVPSFSPEPQAMTASAKDSWTQLLPFRRSKKTFAPPSAVKDLDDIMAPGTGSVIEVLVAWQDRVISVYHSKKNETITIGTSKQATIQVPNLVQDAPYPLVHFSQIAQINIASDMTRKNHHSKKSGGF